MGIKNNMNIKANLAIKKSEILLELVAFVFYYEECEIVTNY